MKEPNMMDEGPEPLDGFGDEVSRMLHTRALRHPEHTDPVGITERHLRAARSRRRTVLGATTTLVVAGGAAFGGYAGHASSPDKAVHAPAPDYAAAALCAASAKVPVDIPRGATAAVVAHALFTAGVVKSESAYIDAANRNQGSSGITAGTYAICPRISAGAAVSELLKKSNLSQASQIVVTPHEWSQDVVASLIAKRKWKQADFDKAVADNTIGLPAWSVDSAGHGFTIEGMLEPGTYSITASDSPQSILTRMVAGRMAFLQSIGFEAKGGEPVYCGTSKCTPEQVLTVASIAESEVADPEDGRRVAEGVYQRLAVGDYVGVDSTALYGLGHLPPGQKPTMAQMQDPDNRYSTYAPHHGLPPTPISIPSDDMIKAALAPTREGVYYWCSGPTGVDFFTRAQKAAFAEDCAATR